MTLRKSRLLSLLILAQLKALPTVLDLGEGFPSEPRLECLGAKARKAARGAGKQHRHVPPWDLGSCGNGQRL